MIKVWSLKAMILEIKIGWILNTLTLSIIKNQKLVFLDFFKIYI